MSNRKSGRRTNEEILGRGLSDLLALDEDDEPRVDEPQVEAPAEQVPAGDAAPRTTGSFEVDDLDVLHSFLQESSEHLETVEQTIMRLEESRSEEGLDEIFRSMHTIKGTSGFFGPNSITSLSHGLESVLDAVRGGAVDVSAELVDVLLAGADELSAMVEHLASEARIRSGDSPPLSIPDRPGGSPAILSRIEVLQSGEAPQAAPSQTLVQMPAEEGLITEELRESFAAETADLLSQAEADILALETDPGALGRIDRPFRNVHTIKGNAGFLGLARVESMCSQIEEVLQVLRSGEQAVSQPVVTAILESLDSLEKMIASDRESDGGERADDEAAYRPLGKILVEMGLVDEEAVENALEAQERKLGEILVAEGRATEEGIAEALARQRQSLPAGGARGPEPERKAIRVDVSKLDKLFELVGELITAEAMVVSNPDLEDLELERFNRAAGYLGKITRQMQEIAMSVRMIPLEGLFNKTRRLVRDLSRRTGKPIEISVSGEDTEVDRNVIEVLADPLVHIIRNCADHGIEPPEDREAAGKAREGRIRLSAHYEGSEIWITVRDDGRGLNRDAILVKAVANGLTTEEESPGLSDEKVWEFLFQPGFSTAATVTDVSGRGVGMDVVKRNIEQLRGKIDVRTATGQWTEVILKIPLTMAIIDGVTTKVGSILYAIPLSDIREFHREQPERITTTTTSGEVLRLRESIIPIIRLRDYFHANGQDTPGTDGVLIIVQSGADQVALLVDEIVGYNQIVIKALPEYMGQMQGLSGCSVLGNGDVSLIVDTSALVEGRVS